MPREISIAVRARPFILGSLALGAAALAVAIGGSRPPGPAAEVPVACVDPEPELSAPLVPAPEPPAANVPGPDVYALLDACLRQGNPAWAGKRVDVDQVRYWVEVEHDPAWFDERAATWWLPLSNEGIPGNPSGSYISVPLSGASCGGALIN